jgi:hypothetical protein
VDGRFVWPLLPLALEALAAAAAALAARRPAARAPALALAGALVAWCALGSARAAARPPSVAERLPARTFAWARERLPADAAVLTDLPRAFTLYTDRKAALTDAAEAADADEFLARLRAQGFAYICYRDWTVPAGANLPATERAVRAFAASLRWVDARPRAYTRVYFDADEGAAIYAVAPAGLP